MPNAPTPGTPKRYLSVGEIAEVLGRTGDNVRYWISHNLFPDPDAVFGSPDRNNISLWDRERLTALIIDDGTDPDFSGDDANGDTWNTTPTRYITSYGIAALLRLSPNTVKWWLLDEDQRRAAGEKKRRTDRVGKTKDLVSLPPCDAVSAWASGWEIETIWNWWNNDHPRMVQDEFNRQRSVVFSDLLDHHRVAVVDFAPDTVLQVRAAYTAHGDRVDYVPATAVLAEASSEETTISGCRTPGCWFIPDLSTLRPDDQKITLDYLASIERPSIALCEEMSDLPAGLADDQAITVIDRQTLDQIITAQERDKASS